MPFKSKAQARKLAMLAGQGKFPMKSLYEWASATKNFKRLPERLKKK